MSAHFGNKGRLKGRQFLTMYTMAMRLINKRRKDVRTLSALSIHVVRHQCCPVLGNEDTSKGKSNPVARVNVAKVS